MSWCGCVCEAVEDAAEWVEDQVEEAAEAVVDAVEEGFETIGEFLEEAGEYIEEKAEDLAQYVASVADAVWDWITETGSAIWDWVKKVAGQVWEWTMGAMEDAWEWACEAASDAWDWISSAATTIWDALCVAWEAVVDFVEEKVVPFLLDVLWVLTHIDDLLVAGVLGTQCLLAGIDEWEYDEIEGLFLLDKDVLARRKVAFLSGQEKYVIFSDLHLFVAGDPLDRFRQIGNNELYQAVLATYWAAGYTLVENGDIEDLWMRETTLGGALFDEMTEVLGWPYGDMMEEEYETQRIRAQVVKIFDNNQDIYGLIRSLYHDSGRYVRLLGNHDDSWASGDFLPGLQIVYPGLQVYDYALIGDYDSRPPVYGNSPRVIIAHGHQLDAWNNSICRESGAALTAGASGIPSLAANVKERSEWEAELRGSGFPNELGERIDTINELEFYETTQSDFGNYAYMPEFILGHTHDPREASLIPGWMFRDEWHFKEYTNTGTAGRWEQFIWCATVENGDVGLHGWTWNADGSPGSYRFRGGYAGSLRIV